MAVKLKRDSVTGHMFDESLIVECPHPAVNRRYGPTVSIYTCAKCAFNYSLPWLKSSIGCAYELFTNNKSDSNG